MLDNRLKMIIGAAAALAVMATLVYVTMALFPDTVRAAPGETGLAAEVLRWGYVAAALATGASALGAAVAVASVGAAAVGAVAEKPELFGRMLVLVGLAEGIAIYGLIISIMILNRLT